MRFSLSTCLLKFLMGAIQVSLACAYTDVAPEYSSAINSLGNMISAVAGIFGPIIVGVLTTKWPENNGIWGWRVSFIITAVMSAFSLVLWAIYQTSDIVPALNNPTPKLKYRSIPSNDKS
jgi:MFS family permease